MSRYGRTLTIIVAAGACAAFAAAAALAQTAPPVPKPAAIDFTDEAMKAIATLATVVVSAIVVEIRGVVKDKTAQDFLVGVLERGAAFLVNRTAGALKNQPLSVQLASPMAAELVRYAKQYGGWALKRLDVDDVHLAKMAIGALPNVQGSLSDADILDIAAKATGKAQVPATSMLDLAAVAKELAPLVMKEVATLRQPSPAVPGQA